MIKLSFMPKDGARSNYYDCVAKSPDGSIWKSSGNRWSLLQQAAPSTHRKQELERSGSFVHGCLGFALSMVLFARPVAMTFPSFGVGFPILLVISFISAAIFIRAWR